MFGRKPHRLNHSDWRRPHTSAACH
jgi:hypothetical protein